MTQDTIPRIDPARLEDLTAFRRAMHQRPETAFDVSATAAVVADRLAAAGLEVTPGVGGSGVVASLRRGSGTRGIGLRADLDALPITEATDLTYASTTPGAFHGCGHDGHTTMLLGAALDLAARDDLDGSVHFLFQPDEENGRGAQAMIDDGLFTRFPIDEVYGLHNLPGLELGAFATCPGALTAFEELFTIVIEGRGGHSSAPDVVIDPVVTAAQVIVGLQSIVARALSPRDHGVVSVTEVVTDGARNIIPSMVTVRGDVRGYDDRVSATIQARMREIVAGVAAANGARATVTYGREFEPAVNTAAEVALVAAAVGRIPGTEVDPACDRVGFSEDFAQFLRHGPAASC